MRCCNANQFGRTRQRHIDARRIGISHVAFHGGEQAEKSHSDDFPTAYRLIALDAAPKPLSGTGVGLPSFR
jgi:hypothetical protein